MAKQLPDTPWHIGSPKMKESDHRRLNKWCVHYDNMICKEPHSGCYLVRCNGSSHCKFYSETQASAERIAINNQTQDEIDAINRKNNIESLKPKMDALIASSDGRRFSTVQALYNCYVCNSRLLEVDVYRKQCPLCHMIYINLKHADKEKQSDINHYVFVMGHKQGKLVKKAVENPQCEFQDSLGRCQDDNSALFRKHCKPRYCEKLKKNQEKLTQLEKQWFSGVTELPVTSIKLPTISYPKQAKINCEIEYIQKTGTVHAPILVEASKDKFMLKRGIIQYFAAVQYGLTTIPATMEWENGKY